LFLSLFLFLSHPQSISMYFSLSLLPFLAYHLSLLLFLFYPLSFLFSFSFEVSRYPKQASTCWC
jgi:CBS domain containing-hemolysin-like protein